VPGSSLRSDIAFKEQNPAIVIGVTQASAPPVTTASANPPVIRR